MKVTKGKTTFEFTDKEVELLNDCYTLLDEVFSEMTESETLCGYSDSNLEDDVLSFLRELTYKINPSGVITCK